MKLGISSCLLGNNVRYNGGHTRDRYVTEQLGKFISWIPVCPEVECGLSVPREAMRLVGTAKEYRLVTIKTGIDHTKRMQSWSKKRLEQLATEELCGFVFKSKSPSSGMRGVKLYSPKGGQPSHNGIGMFAKAFMDRFPELPVEDEGRLHDAKIRENFIERVFCFSRWKQYTGKKISIQSLIQFHTDHKLMIMAHNPKALKELGALVASTTRQTLNRNSTIYIITFLEAMKLVATVKKNTNVLQHIMGYFKKLITKDEKRELVEVIENYHSGYVPLVVPLVLLQHYVRKYNVEYLKQQHYLHPHPKELMLRNHV